MCSCTIFINFTVQLTDLILQAASTRLKSALALCVEGTVFVLTLSCKNWIYLLSNSIKFYDKALILSLRFRVSINVVVGRSYARDRGWDRRQYQTVPMPI